MAEGPLPLAGELLPVIWGAMRSRAFVATLMVVFARARLGPVLPGLSSPSGNKYDKKALRSRYGKGRTRTGRRLRDASVETPLTVEVHDVLVVHIGWVALFQTSDSGEGGICLGGILSSDQFLGDKNNEHMLASA